MMDDAELLEICERLDRLCQSLECDQCPFDESGFCVSLFELPADYPKTMRQIKEALDKNGY